VDHYHIALYDTHTHMRACAHTHTHTHANVDIAFTDRQAHKHTQKRAHAHTVHIIHRQTDRQTDTYQYPGDAMSSLARSWHF